MNRQEQKNLWEEFVAIVIVGILFVVTFAIYQAVAHQNYGPLNKPECHDMYQLTTKEVLHCDPALDTQETK